jgi:hypothetical protein
VIQVGGTAAFDARVKVVIANLEQLTVTLLDGMLRLSLP